MAGVALAIGVRCVRHSPPASRLSKPRATAYTLLDASPRFSGYGKMKARGTPGGKRKGRRIAPPPASRNENVRAYQFFVMRNPNRRGSVVKTLVLRPVSSELRNAPVIAVVSNPFFT